MVERKIQTLKAEWAPFCVMNKTLDQYIKKILFIGGRGYSV